MHPGLRSTVFCGFYTCSFFFSGLVSGMSRPVWRYPGGCFIKTDREGFFRKPLRPNHYGLKMKSVRSGSVKLFLVAALVAGLVIFSSCVGTEQDMRYLNDQIVALSSRVSDIEETVHDRMEGRLEAGLAGLKDRQVETGQDVDELKQEMRFLSNRAEEHRVLVQRAVERDMVDQDFVRDTLSDLEQRSAILEASVAKVMDHLGMEPPRLPAREPVAVLPDPVEPLEPLRPVMPEKPRVEPVEPDEALYKKTLAFYRDGDFDEAMGGFERLLAQYPDSRYAENAQFWIGECYMSLNQFEQAILSYQKVITEYPEGNKVPGATYRQAVAFHEINDKISARLLLNRVIRSYPDSEEAALAKKKLEAIE